jgi:HlyD family secretion protein
MNFESPIAEDAFSEDESILAARRKRILTVSAILLVAIVVALLVMKLFFGAKTAELTESAGPVVTVVMPGRGTVAATISATGSLAARREMPVGITGEGGAVKAVLVEPGQWVAQGQVLASVERSVQLEQTRSLAASIGVAQADARLAQSELERAQALVARGFISRADIERKTATRDAAMARVRVAQAQLGEQRARVGRLDIRAPAAGLVLTRAVEPGQIIGSGSGTLFRIARGGELEMLAKVSESDLAQLSVGISAKVVPVGSAQGYTGQVWQISPVVDPQSRQGTARIALAFNKDLRPGGFASATIVSGSSDVPVLPESALQHDEKGSYVFIVNAQNTVERRYVKLGQVSESGVSILDGLTGQEKVVTLAGGFLIAGQKVRPELARAGQ